MISSFDQLPMVIPAATFWQAHTEPASIQDDGVPDDPMGLFGRKDQVAMIDGLAIKNFRGFSDLDIPRLTKFTLLGGGNNVGKTSVLEALWLYYARMNALSFVGLQQLRGLNELPLSPVAMWAPFFARYNLATPISIELRFKDRVDKLSIAYQTGYSPKITAQRGSQGVPVVQGNQSASQAHSLKMELSSGGQVVHRSFLVMEPNGLRMEMEKSLVPAPGALITARVPSNVRDDALRFGALDIQNRDSEILEFIKIVEPRLISLSAVAIGNGTVVHGDIGLGVKMPVYHMGDGVVRILNIILTIATSPGGVVMIDEFGTGLHYSILSRICQAVAAAAEKYDVQVIATTHSYELLEEAHKGLVKSNPDSFAYIRIDRSGAAATANRYDYETLGVALEQEWEIR
jgi:predicted ATPase